MIEFSGDRKGKLPHGTRNQTRETDPRMQETGEWEGTHARTKPTKGRPFTPPVARRSVSKERAKHARMGELGRQACMRVEKNLKIEIWSGVMIHPPVNGICIVDAKID